jgi:hypothetical protein
MISIGPRSHRKSGFRRSSGIVWWHMDEQTLPDDFKEFLKLLTEHAVEYLLIGGYAVGYHGYPRATADMDIWVAVSPENASRLVSVFKLFGLSDATISPATFQTPGRIIRMGLPPMRIEVLTDIDGVEFAECHAARVQAVIDNQHVCLISKEHLLRNKRASGRFKDLDDVEHLADG